VDAGALEQGYPAWYSSWARNSSGDNTGSLLAE